MEKIDKVLSFYVKANRLKGFYDDDNYSISDHLFGSMILATAINSEFSETDDLAKIHRMIFLSGFTSMWPDYDFSTLNLGETYKKEADHALDIKTKEGLLVARYRVLDLLLTNLILEKRDKLSAVELVDEGSNLVSLMCNKNPEECEEIFKFFLLNFKLENKVRTGWDKNHWNVKSNRIERISEHVVETVGLAMVLISEFNYSFDTDKAINMLAIHETGETLIGDITPFDGVTAEEKKEREHKAMREALSGLEKQDDLLALLFEFDDENTPAASFAHKCDKITADLQAKIYQEQRLQHSLDDQANNCVFKSARVQKMVENGAQTAFDIWYEWDKSIYQGDSFPEFANILNYAKNNDLISLLKHHLQEPTKQIGSHPEQS